MIPKLQQEVRWKCCMAFRKTYRNSDFPDLLFLDECYVNVRKHFNHQNEMVYGKDFSVIPVWKRF